MSIVKSHGTRCLSRPSEIPVPAAAVARHGCGLLGDTMSMLLQDVRSRDNRDPKLRLWSVRLEPNTLPGSLWQCICGPGGCWRGSVLLLSRGSERMPRQ
jgi:hypothetical protein